MESCCLLLSCQEEASKERRGVYVCSCDVWVCAYVLKFGRVGVLGQVSKEGQVCVGKGLLDSG